MRILSERNCLKVFPQVSENCGTRTGLKFHFAPAWWEVSNYVVACDRIEGVLQVVFHAQKTLGFAEDLAFYRERISPHFQNTDGEAEGISLPSLHVNRLI
jgi:hypothetical protein